MFQIFIVDKENNKYVELDVEGIDFTSVFAISDINDISTRKDSLTKNLKFKPTSHNNKAFGYAFHLNKNIDESDSNKLFWNYNPQVLVDCLIYENSTLLTKGSLRLIELTPDVSYECVLTGDIISFNGLIADKLLTDLDLTDLTHTYSTATMFSSWNDALTLGYTYPIINYGNDFHTNADENTAYTNAFNALNFKPAVFVTKIFDKIFDGAGFSYEIKGNSAFKDYFNSLLIPNNDEKLISIYPFTGGTRALSVIKTTANNRNDATQTQSGDLGVRVHLTLDNLTDTLSLVDVGANFATQASPSSLYRPNKVFNITKSFKTGGVINFEYTFRNSNSSPVELWAVFELLERDVIDPSNTTQYHNSDNWNSVASTTLTVPNTGGSDVVKTGSLNIAEREFLVGKQLSVKITFYARNTSSNGELGTTKFFFNVYKADVLFPSAAGDRITTDITIGDTITPTLANGVKQLDFLQSIRNLFNFYVYADTDIKKIIFERYDDYYASTAPNLLPSGSLDWTNKIDYTTKPKFKSNVLIPKNYNFKFKPDSDFVNDYYQKVFGKSYGDYNLADSNGITDKKTVEVIFSPTPLITVPPTINGASAFNLNIPWIYKPDSSNNVLPTVSNIRILSYSGMITGNLDVITEKFVSGAWSVDTVNHRTSIPLVSNYYFKDGVAIYDLHFGKPDRVFFNESSAYLTPKYSFGNYQNQINELRNPNVSYVECEALLNEIDVNNLDLKIPVFIDTGSNGHAYFKVTKVEYKSSLETSSIELQKINF